MLGDYEKGTSGLGSCYILGQDGVEEDSQITPGAWSSQSWLWAMVGAFSGAGSGVRGVERTREARKMSDG